MSQDPLNDLRNFILGQLAERMVGSGEESPYTAANLEQAMALISAGRETKPKVGDLVVLRDHVAKVYKWPKAGEKCIVTQVISPPWRHGAFGTSQIAVTHDFAIAFVDGDGDVVEFAHDSRNFRVVGNIEQ